MADDGLFAWIEDALAPLGALRKQRMMGGWTLYLDGTVFAIVDDGELWMKADAVSDAVWDAAGCARFTYAMGDKIGTMNYRRAPGDVYDDGEALREWAALALEAGRRKPVKKAQKKKA